MPALSLHKILHEIVRPFSDLNKQILLLKEFVLSKLNKHAIFIDADIYRSWTGKIQPQNWGDDLNAHLWTALFPQKAFFSFRTFIKEREQYITNLSAVLWILTKRKISANVLFGGQVFSAR